MGDQFSFFGCPDKPNRVGPTTIVDPRNSSFTNNNPSGSGTAKQFYFFNPNSFAPSAGGIIGNVGRNPFHGPGINNTDLVLAKSTKITERKSIELRLESFNLFNHTQFENPNGNVNSSNFGRVSSTKQPRIIQLGAKFYF